MKKLFFFLFLLSLSITTFAQTPARHKIAVFAPLYLDSVFDAGNNYRFGKEFPKFINPGLEFYQGAQMALDSLQKAGAPLEVFIYDSRSKRTPIAQQLNHPAFKEVEMIIANASTAEVKLLADAALRKKVPFISATSPNDAGVTNNPFMVVLNSTLRAHCEGIYQYLQRYHRNDRIIVFRKNGLQENQIRDNLNEISKSTSSAPLNLEFVDLGNGFTVSSLLPRLDSTRRNICITGTLDENFGMNLARELASVSETYQTTVIGMPTWDGKDFSNSEFKNLEIVYSTPFYYSRAGGLGAQITREFESAINSRPSDMFYRGYEVVLRFALLLLDTKKDIASNLTRKGNYVFTQFDIQPVFLNKSNMTLDYFENKKLYFVKTLNGIKSVVN